MIYLLLNLLFTFQTHGSWDNVHFMYGAAIFQFDCRLVTNQNWNTDTAVVENPCYWRKIITWGSLGCPMSNKLLLRNKFPSLVIMNTRPFVTFLKNLFASIITNKVNLLHDEVLRNVFTVLSIRNLAVSKTIFQKLSPNFRREFFSPSLMWLLFESAFTMKFRDECSL